MYKPIHTTSLKPCLSSTGLIYNSTSGMTYLYMYDLLVFNELVFAPIVEAAVIATMSQAWVDNQ